METNPKRMTKSLKEFKEWCKKNRNKRIRTIVDMVNKKLMGYFNYYAIEGNSKKISQFYYIAKGILYKWLNRRNQRKSFNFEQFKEKKNHYGLIKPRIQKSLYKQLSIEDYSFV